MGFFDFIKSSVSSSNNIETENGLNKIYFDDGKSTQIQKRFTKKNGVREGVLEEFYKNGSLSGKYEYVNDLQHGLTQSFCVNGSLFRESKFQNDERIGVTKEFYSDGSIRFEYDSAKHKYTFYSKKGKKTVIAYIKIYTNPVSHISFSFTPEIYKARVVNPGRHNRILKSPFGKWKIFNNNEELDYELDFRLLSDLFSIETVEKKYLNKSGDIISSEMLDISKLNTDYSSYYNISNRKDELIDFDLKIDDIIKFKKIEIDHKTLASFIQESNGSKVYAFERHYCAMKLMFEMMILNGGIDSYKDLIEISSIHEDKNNWERGQCFKNNDFSIEYKYVKAKYSVNKTSFHGASFSLDLHYVLIIKDTKLNNSEIINENDLEDIGIVSHYKSKPFTGTGHVLYEDGKIKIETQFKNGLKDGFQKVFYQSGQLAIEYRFSEDKLLKTVQRFLEDGTLRGVS